MQIAHRQAPPTAITHLAVRLWAFLFAALAAFGVSAQTVDISTSPLFAGATASPNVVISASFEFPTAGQAYLCSDANSTSTNCNGWNSSTGASVYSASNTYTGYFDPTKCYVYNSGSSVTTLFPDAQNSSIANNEGDPNGYFSVSGTATNHSCGNFTSGNPNFSGNALNWATMGALDEFRYALTGGNRVNENGPNGGTILSRAYLTGCSTTILNNDNCPNFGYLGQASAVPGVPDFYASSTLFPTLALPGKTFSSSNSTVYINNCKTFMYLSTSNNGSFGFNTGNCTKPSTDAGVYNIRVNVCDSAEGPVRTDLCLQYGGSTGKYKPVGTVQRNAAKMRFAAFGYLIDRSVPAQGSTPAYTVPANCQDSGFSGAPPGLWNRCRVGGVLRSPMKYVGPTTYDVNGIASANAKAEINADGTLVDDPEGNAASFGGKYSGFINYLNKFGTAVQANKPAGSLGGAGEYKRYDTMGEMYYEAIRYYQNLTPTPQTYQATQSQAYPQQVTGYFPMLSGASWPADPIVQQCANNYIISISDTDTWDDVYMPGYAGSPTQNPYNFANSGNVYRPTSRPISGNLDAYAWTKKIGALEAGTSSITANDVRPQMYSQAYPGTPINATAIQDSFTGSQGAFTATYFAAGAAYWAHTNEIRTDLPALPNGQPHTITTISVDTGGQTRPVWDRQLYLMGKYGGFTVPNNARSDHTELNPFYATNPANPTGPGIRSNSEWESAPGSASPANYLRASSPQALISGLQSAFSGIGATSGTASGGSTTSAALNYGAAGTFIAQFTPTRWSGTVLNESVTSVNGVLSVASTPTWDSGALLTTQCGTVAAASTTCTDTFSGAAKRNIFTTIAVSGTRQAKTFTYSNVMGDAYYLSGLNKNPSSGNVDSLAQQRINYLRGYRVDENPAGLGFRPRDSVMGDIINSAPVYIGPPTSGIPDSDYQTFFTANAGRTAAVYVGANDGMLHAFNAATGAELFAYIPNVISSYLADLTYSGYTHEPFVDAIPVIREAKVGGNWKTVLVSGTGAGGQGVFALDVTNPSAFGTANVLFEFTEADDYDLGNVVSAPEIVKLQTGTSAGTPTYGYFAAVTSYNARRPLCRSPGNTALLQALTGSNAFYYAIPICTSNSQGDSYLVQDSANRGILYLLPLDHALNQPWCDQNHNNCDYYKFYFPANSTTAANGLGPVSSLLSKSGSGAAVALYFGDLQGDLWRLNTVGLPSTWTPSIGTVVSPQPLFKAVSSGNVAQPITARPELGTGPFGSTLIAFGTGEYLGTSDLTQPYAQQSEYLLIDTNGSKQISRTANLTPRTATVSSSNATVTIAGNPFSYTPNGTALGWYLDFASTGSGERMVNKAALAPGLLGFTSLTLASSVCVPGGGYIYQVNPVTGLSIGGSTTTPVGFISTVGIPGPPAIVTLATANGVTKGTGESIGQLTQGIVVSGTNGQIAQPAQSITQKGPPTSRVSWREITNYNDRH